MQTKQEYIYVNITKHTILLILIADLLQISKYMLFLLYETFGNDIFLVFTMFNKAGLLPKLTEFRLRRCYMHANLLEKILLDKEDLQLNPTAKKSLQIVNPLLYETKFRIEVDQEAFDG